MVKLRLKRMGSKFNAFYRIIAADARAPRDGRFIEEVGYHNPHTKETFINAELRTKWLNEGAVPTDTVKNIFKKYDALASTATNGIVKFEKKVKVAKVAAPVVEETTEEVAAEESKEA